MALTVQAIVDAQGQVHLLEPLALAGSRRAIVMILDDDLSPIPSETALLSEAALSVDWNRYEEEQAWSYLQPGK